ncbi:hypothetical protein PFISCL1PPCAC_22814, partial [Pristionchus fissidentatus]
RSGRFLHPMDSPKTRRTLRTPKPVVRQKAADPVAKKPAKARAAKTTPRKTIAPKQPDPKKTLTDKKKQEKKDGGINTQPTQVGRAKKADSDKDYCKVHVTLGEVRALCARNNVHADRRVIEIQVEKKNV